MLVVVIIIAVNKRQYEKRSLMPQIISGGQMSPWSQQTLKRISTTLQSMPLIACLATGAKKKGRRQGRAGPGTCISPSSPTQGAPVPFRRSAKAINGTYSKPHATNPWHLYLSGPRSYWILHNGLMAVILHTSM